VLNSDDLDETRDHIARIYKPHDLAVQGFRQRVQARMHHKALGPSLSLNRLAHGAAVRIDPDRLDEFFLVQMPLAGHAQVWHQNTLHTCVPGQATVLSPMDGVRMAWSEGCDQVMLRVDRQRLARVAQALTGRDTGALGPRLLPQFDLRHGPGAHWGPLMNYLARLLQPGAEGPGPGLHTAMLEDHVLATLLQVAWPEAGQVAGTGSGTPLRLRQLEDYVHAHLDQPITVTDLARAVNSSVRRVQQLFASERRTTPLAYIRDKRLERVRHELLHPSPETRVSQTAERWGFEHAGRFASAYLKLFGENPSATLERSRG
jgi:AraC-like DNA-binding protein